MSYEKGVQPKLTPRKTHVPTQAQNYEFNPMNQKDERTLAQQIYDSSTGKFLGRNGKSWCKREDNSVEC